MVVLFDPAENSPSMKIPDGKLDFPWKGPLLNSYSKTVGDMAESDRSGGVLGVGLRMTLPLNNLQELGTPRRKPYQVSARMDIRIILSIPARKWKVAISSGRKFTWFGKEANLLNGPMQQHRLQQNEIFYISKNERF